MVNAKQHHIAPCNAPPRLCIGDRVRVIAPSGPVSAERLLAGIAQLRAWGLQPVYDETELLSRDAYLAGSDERRCTELLAALNDDRASALWAARGGYGAARLLPQLLDAHIIARPRWLIGFSDITALHARWQRAGLQSVHGANVSGLDDWSPTALERLRGWLFDGGQLCFSGEPYASAHASVSGPLLGGNLTVLASLAGTGQLPSFAGAIVFLEDVSEAPYRLDRSLTQLLQAGVFDGASGFAIGQLTNCIDRPGRDYGRDALGAVCATLAGYSSVPILTALAVGHERCSQALPLGAVATLNPGVGELRVTDGQRRET